MTVLTGDMLTGKAAIGDTQQNALQALLTTTHLVNNARAVQDASNLQLSQIQNLSPLINTISTNTAFNPTGTDTFTGNTGAASSNGLIPTLPSTTTAIP